MNGTISIYLCKDYLNILVENYDIIIDFLSKNNDTFERGKLYSFYDFKDKITLKYDDNKYNLVALFKKDFDNCYSITLTEAYGA